ncbi:hypothetical protein Pmani_015484 [Petrolisthes manimaculis]|uniref:Uncharacterized protein n=1 Tax=Petrolisthes manimaculis TaxID=1843537 RepID=A0AAE1U7M5_9EUCA|nr:hypothetical protein Pmani_015484 [Petrolisthes manimaculis]
MGLQRVGVVMMVVCVVVVMMVCMCGDAMATTTTTTQPNTKTLVKRDYNSVPADPVVPSDTGDSGFYYYYYPVEEKGKKGKEGLEHKDHYFKDKCTGEKLLAPLIIICIFLGIIAFRDIGLVPSFQLPDISLTDISLKETARGVTSFAGEYIPWNALDNLTVAVTEAVESEECVQRLVCHSGRYADGRSTIISVMELFMPRRFQSHMRIFKNSALNQSDCDVFRCGYADIYQHE